MLQVRMLSPRFVNIEYDSDKPQFRPGGQFLPVNTQEICYINVSDAWCYLAAVDYLMELLVQIEFEREKYISNGFPSILVT